MTLTPTVPLYGRDAALNALERAVAPGRAVLVHGPPGIGKTALLEAYLSGLPGGRRVDLTDVVTEVDLRAALTRAAGIAGQGGGWLEALADVFRACPVLVLDSVERLDGEAWARVEALRAALPDTALLLGSVVHHAGLSTLPLGPLDPASSRALLIDRVRAADLSRVVDPEDPVWDALVARLDGLPLALTLAASRLGWAPPEVVLAHLDEAVMHGDGRRSSVDGALRFAWDLLGPAERGALTRLAPMSGGFSLSTAFGVLGQDAMAKLDVLRAKAAIVSRAGRLEVLGPLRRVALAEAPREDQEIVVNYWVEYSRELWRIAREGTRGQDPNGLNAEQDNLFAIHALARRLGLADQAAWLGVVAVSSIRRYGPLSRADALGGTEEALRLASEVNSDEIAGLYLATWGAAARDRNLIAAARPALDAALARTQPGRLSLGRCVALADLGWIAFGQRLFAEARDLFLQSVAVAPDVFGEALALNRLAGLDLVEGRREEAAASWQRAIELMRPYPTSQRGGLYLNLALLRAEEGQLVLAEDLLRRAAAESVPHDLPSKASALVVLALLYLTRGEVEAARQAALEGLEIRRSFGLASPSGFAYGALALTCWATGDLSEARRCLQTASSLVDGVDLVAAAAMRAWRAALDAADGDARSLEAELQASQQAGCDPKLVAVLAGFGGAPVPEPAGPEHLEIQVARRLLSRAPPALLVDPEGRWFSWPGHRADLSRRGALRRLLVALVEARVDQPGSGLTVGEMFEAGWPGERAVPEAAAARVYTAIRTLRNLGLGEALRREADGYMLDPGVPIEVRRDNA